MVSKSLVISAAMPGKIPSEVPMLINTLLEFVPGPNNSYMRRKAHSRMHRIITAHHDGDLSLQPKVAQHLRKQRITSFRNMSTASNYYIPMHLLTLPPFDLQ